VTASGIYVHLPYCRSRCGYCAFVVSTDDSSAGAYRRALDREMELVRSEASKASFDTLYLGGGTPSLTPAGELEHLLGALRRSFAVCPGAEVTLEANPEDVTLEAASAWAAAGVNRVSVGVQSFEDRELSAVGRRHDSAGASRALETLAGGGFSLSGDLILGLPEQTAETFRKSLARLVASGVEHVSVYLLEAEKSRTLEEDRRLHPERYLSDDAQADAWLEMGDTLAAAGFRHYEISNWAREGRRARHNVKYWLRTPTLGLGVSAHELWGGRRRANVSGLERYIAELESGRRPLALDQPVSEGERRREEIVLGLRLSEGVAAERLREAVRESGDPALAADSEAWVEGGLLEEADGRIRFTERGFLLSNEILCRFV
jgi:oxygen-independent coproporphyrinogen-3 oxidase